MHTGDSWDFAKEWNIDVVKNINAYDKTVSLYAAYLIVKMCTVN